MTNKEISEQLLKIVSSKDFASSSIELTEAWSKAAVGVDSVDAILEFMEAHPNINYGIPGSLVHFVEKFYHKGYEEKLIKSISRKPTMVTVWMLNRLINGTQDSMIGEQLISIMRQAATNPKADQQTIQSINDFLIHQSY